MNSRLTAEILGRDSSMASDATEKMLENLRRLDSKTRNQLGSFGSLTPVTDMAIASAAEMTGSLNSGSLIPAI